jgi:hypothetical protein
MIQTLNHPNRLPIAIAIAVVTMIAIADTGHSTESSGDEPEVRVEHRMVRPSIQSGINQPERRRHRKQPVPRNAGPGPEKTDDMEQGGLPRRLLAPRGPVRIIHIPGTDILLIIGGGGR